MAFLLANFAPAGNQSRRGASPQEYNYKTTDSQATVGNAGYFNQVLSMLNFGDVINVEVVDSLTAPTAVTSCAPFLVTAISTTSITVTKTIPALADDEGAKSSKKSAKDEKDSKDNFGSTGSKY